MVCAYRLKGAYSYKNQDGIHDGEFSAGLKMLRILKDKEVEDLAVFIVHYSGATKLGVRHFEIYQQLTEQAAIKMAKPKRSNRQRLDSQSSLTSLASVLLVGEDTQDSQDEDPRD